MPFCVKRLLQDQTSTLAGTFGLSDMEFNKFGPSSTGMDGAEQEDEAARFSEAAVSVGEYFTGIMEGGSHLATAENIVTEDRGGFTGELYNPSATGMNYAENMESSLVTKDISVDEPCGNLVNYISSETGIDTDLSQPDNLHQSGILESGQGDIDSEHIDKVIDEANGGDSYSAMDTSDVGQADVTETCGGSLSAQSSNIALPEESEETASGYGTLLQNGSNEGSGAREEHDADSGELNERELQGDDCAVEELKDGMEAGGGVEGDEGHERIEITEASVDDDDEELGSKLSTDGAAGGEENAEAQTKTGEETTHVTDCSETANNGEPTVTNGKSAKVISEDPAVIDITEDDGDTTEVSLY